MNVMSASFLGRYGLLALLLLCACGSEPAATAPSPDSASPTSAPSTALAALAEGQIDVSGCWRPASASGNATGGSFTFNRVGPADYVFSTTPNRTKLVFKADRSFEEVNFDDKKPFFPKGYIHSSGSISEDGNTISRTISGDSQPQTLRRCELVGERVFVPVTEPTRNPNPIQTPTPEATYAPLRPGETPTRPQPSPTSSPEPEPATP